MCAVLCTVGTECADIMSCSTVSYQVCSEDYQEPGYEASNSLATFSPCSTAVLHVSFNITPGLTECGDTSAPDLGPINHTLVQFKCACV